jgi:hypothetical protein
LVQEQTNRNAPLLWGDLKSTPPNKFILFVSRSFVVDSIRISLDMLSKDCANGFPAEWFVSVSDELICGLCLDILNDPHQCTNGHLYCKKCITDCLKSYKVCPSCKCEIDPEKIPKNLYAKKVIQCLPSLCPSLVGLSKDQFCEGCDWVGEFYLRDKHYVTECGQNLVIECICGKKFRSKEDSDMHAAECLFAIARCDNCATNFLRSDLKTHQVACFETSTRCSRGLMMNRNTGRHIYVNAQHTPSVTLSHNTSRSTTLFQTHPAQSVHVNAVPPTNPSGSTTDPQQSIQRQQANSGGELMSGNMPISSNFDGSFQNSG